MGNAYKILIVDDVKSTTACLAELFTEKGWQTETAYSGDDALVALSKHRFDLAILDIKMQTMSGIELLRKIREKDSKMPVIMMSAYHTIETAAKAVALDVFDILQKPFMLQDALAMAKRALAYGVALEGAIDLDLVVTPYRTWMNIVAESEAMQKACFAAAEVAPTSASVLIVGEKGTGRTAMAKAIHESSLRNSKPFVLVDASAHKNASVPEMIARLSQDERSGTLFVKELHLVPERDQKQLAEFLREECPVEDGTSATAPRFIASLDYDAWKQGCGLDDELAAIAGQMRIDIAPLRERPPDILPLAHHFLQRLRPANSAIPLIDIEVTIILERYSWPGNVAEMESLIRHIRDTAGPSPARICASMLPEKVTRETGPIPPPHMEELKNDFLHGMKLRAFLATASKEEMKRISELLDAEKRSASARHFKAHHPDSRDR